jgi:flagellar hook-associated protein 2
MAAAVGSTGLDVQSLVSQLVTSERNQYLTPITARETTATVQLSAISSLKGSLSTFQTAVNGLTDAASMTPRATSSSDEDVLTVTSTGDASTGSYDIQVIDLAQAQQLASGPFSGGASTKVGTGTMTITYGTKTFDVKIDDTNNTLSNIRDAINKASGNTGVQASIINEQNGSRLVLTSSQTGKDNSIKVAVNGGDGGLAQFAYDGVNPSSVTQLKAAQDAHIKVGTYDVYNSSNVISSAIDDVTITLKSKSDDPVTLTVSADQTALKTKVGNFVTAYNTLYAAMSKLRAYDPSTETAGPLLGDALLRGIENQIGLDLSNPVAGATGDYKTLASLGITRQTDGTLKVDGVKLDKALTADPNSVAKVFGGDTGVAGKLSKDLDNVLKDGAGIDVRSTQLNDTLKSVQDDKDQLDARMQVIQDRYTKQFTALDTLLTQLQSTSNYLTSQLASLPKAG